MAIWTIEIKELEKLYVSFKGQLPELGKELVQLVHSDDPNVILLYSRRCLEVIITELCEYELNRERGTEPLKSIIDKLNKEKKVPSHIIASMHGLNTLSTFGTHPKDFDPEQVKPVLNNLYIIIKWYLRYKDFQVTGKPEYEEEKYESHQSIDSSEEKSIAVLPFVDMSPERDQGYFCEGIAEEILNILCHMKNLKVVARTSSFAFRGSDRDIREIGKKLEVKNILEGSIRKSGNRIRITAQLINATSGLHIWSEKYDRDITDVFAIQDEISQAIVDNLSGSLESTGLKHIEKYKVTYIDAYLSYLKGNYHYQYTKPDEVKKAIEYYSKALESDPGFAPAYCGVAKGYWSLSYWGNLPPNQAFPVIIEQMNLAKKIDGSLEEIYFIEAVTNYAFHWNLDQAEEDFKKALQINPNSAISHSTYSFLLTCTARHEESILEARKAAELDPLDIYYQNMIANAYNFAGRYEEAISYCRMIENKYAEVFLVYFLLGFAYHGLSMWEEAISAYEKSLRMSGGAQLVLANLIVAYIETGNMAKADSLYKDMVALAKKIFVLPTHFYKVHRAKGENDLAFEWFKRALREHDGFVPLIRVHPYKKLRFPEEERYTDLLKEAGFKDA